MSAACATLPAVTTVPASRDDADPSPAAPLTAEDLVAATGGTLLRRSDRAVRGGAVDSRLVGQGCLFVALPGERTDGHRFLADAAASGAAASTSDTSFSLLRIWAFSVSGVAAAKATSLMVALANAAMGTSDSSRQSARVITVVPSSIW